MRAEVAILGLFVLGYAAGYDGIAEQLPSVIGDPLQQLHGEVNKIGKGDLSTLTGKGNSPNGQSAGGRSNWSITMFQTGPRPTPNPPPPPPPPPTVAKSPTPESGSSFFSLPKTSKVSGLFDSKPSSLPAATASPTVVPVCPQEGMKATIGKSDNAVSPQSAELMTGKVLKVLCLRPVAALRRGTDRPPLTDRDRAALTDWAESRGYSIVSVFTVGDGADDPELEALLQEVGERQFDAVLPIDPDGLSSPASRSGADPVMRRLREAGVAILRAAGSPLSASAGDSGQGLPADQGRI